MLYPDLRLSLKLPASRYGLKIPYDFAFHVQGMEPLIWNYTVDFSNHNGFSMKSSETEKGRLMANTMKRYSSLFLRDAWDPESLKDFKNTIVFTERTAFALFKDLLKDVKTNTPISALYIDVDKGKIDPEYSLKMES
jgi:hypothetical protein